MSDIQYLIEESRRLGLSLNQEWAERLFQACKNNGRTGDQLEDQELNEDDSFERLVWEFFVPDPATWSNSNIWDTNPSVRNHFLDLYEAVLREHGILNEQTFPNYRAMHAEQSYPYDTTRVTPDCCDGVRQARSISLHASRIDSGPIPFWAVMSQSQHGGGLWSNGFMTADFCPHCGKKLPDIELRPTQRNICTPDETGDYCSLCKNRLRACTCAPPEWRWRPVKTPQEPDAESH